MKVRIKVNDSIIGGSQPESIDHVRWLISALGIRTIINLQTGASETETKWCYRTGMGLIDLSLNGILPPSRDTVEFAIEVLGNKTLAPIFLHCRHGRERTGFVIAAYRMLIDKWPFDRAYKEWLQLGCKWPQKWLWKNALRSYAIDPGKS